MSSSSRQITLALALSSLGCAAFERGEYWHDDTEGASEAEDDGDGTGGEAGASDGSGGGASAGSEGGSETTGGGSMPIGFASDVLPLLHAGCDGCHTSDGAAGDTSFLLDVDEDLLYEMVLGFVDVDEPSASRLLAKSAGQGHTGGVIYDDQSDEYATILAWITQGAAP